MDRISWYSRLVLGLTGCFLFFLTGYFLGGQTSPHPYQVTAENMGDTARTEAAITSDPRERPDSLLEGEVINVNTASVYDLQRLPGIGAVRAAEIVDYRTNHGPFSCLDELTDVSGIGEKTVEELQAYACVR